MPKESWGIFRQGADKPTLVLETEETARSIARGYGVNFYVKFIPSDTDKYQMRL